MISVCTAYDVILVDRSGAEAPTTTPDQLPPPSIAASECLFRFGSICSSSNSNRNRENRCHIQTNSPTTTAVYLVVHDSRTGDTLRFPISAHNTIQQPDSVPSSSSSSQGHCHDPVALQQLIEALTTTDRRRGITHPPHPYALEEGPYPANFVLISTTTTTTTTDHSNTGNDNNDTTKNETILGLAPLRIFRFRHVDPLVIVDVDGTITTSTLSGFWNTAVRQEYSVRHCHAGICSLLNQLVHPTNRNNTTTNTNTNNNDKNIQSKNQSQVSSSSTIATNTNQTRPVQLIYLTNRPITYVDATRSLLNELHDDDGCTLPKGPLIGFTGNLAGVFKMDFYHANAHDFKYNTLKKYVCQPFADVGVREPTFYAGFGNTWSDMYAYHRAGIEAHRMFLIDKKSRIYVCNAHAPNNERSDKDTDRAHVVSVDASTFDHPKQYESLKGTMFASGYLDPSLMTYISNL